ncbi:MAG: hypothetical protein ACTJHU_04820 [Mycetocola sp.]
MTSPQKKTGGRFQQLPGGLAIGWTVIAIWVLLRSEESTRFVHAGILLFAALISGIVALIAARRRRAAGLAAEQVAAQSDGHSTEGAPGQTSNPSSEQ